MTKQLTPLDYYLQELLQLNRSIKAAEDQLSIAWERWEVEYLEESLQEMKDRKATLVQKFNEGTYTQKSPK